MNASTSSKTRRRASLGLVLAAALGLAVVGPSPAIAAKGADRAIGSQEPGTLGAQFNHPADIAVNEKTDTFYVADRDNNRIQRFDGEGNFELAFGRDVIEAGAPGDLGDGFEICTAAADCKAGSSGTSSDAPGGEMWAPRALSIDEDTGEVYVTDGGNIRIQSFDADGNWQLAWGVNAIAPGAPSDTGNGFEICTVAADCGKATFGSGAGQFQSSSNTGLRGIAVSRPDSNPASGRVFVADGGSVGGNQNSRVQEFDLDGHFIRLWGWGVATGANQFEICTTNCRSGDYLETEPENGQFAQGSPKGIAIDEQGIVYAPGSAEFFNGAIFRFDSTQATPEGLLLPNPLAGPTGSANVPGWSAGPLCGSIGSIDFDPVSGHVLAGTFCPALGQVVQEIDPSTPVTIVDNHLGGVVVPSGLGVNAGRDELLVSTDGESSQSGNRVYILDDDGSPPPLVSVAPATSVEAGSADLKATITPGGPVGIATSYQFEYARDGGPWITSPAAPVHIGDGNDPVAVTRTIEGLESHTLYRFRLVATKAMGAASVVSPEQTFLTDAKPPTVTALGVNGYTDTSAWLAGRINAEGNPTSYYFEYGSDSGYGTKLPVPDGDAGSGGAVKSFVERVDGLEPEATYHYRLVAENVEGITVGDDVTFTTRGPFAGFAQRAYEQSSPVDKAGNDIEAKFSAETGDQEYGGGPVAIDGNAVYFHATQALGDQDWGGPAPGGGNYVAQRTTTGWVTHSPRPRPERTTAGEWGVRLVGGEDAEFSALFSPYAITGDPAPHGGLYLHQRLANTTSLLVALDTPATPSGGASDLSTVTYPGGGKIYAAHDGQLDPIAMEPVTDLPFATPARVAEGSTRGNVSDDGQQIFFETPVESEQRNIFRRNQGTTTTLVSPSKRSPLDPLGPRRKTFMGASRDGAVLLFTSAEELTDDANTGPSRSGSDLYRYEIATDTLIDLSAEVNTVDGARVQGVVGSSDDGSWVYYVALGQVVSGQGRAGERNFYLWHADGTSDGETRFIATLSGSSKQPDVYRSASPLSRVSPDGQTVIFNSDASLTGYRNEGHAEVYVYEAAANAGAGQLSCASCRPTALPPSGDSTVPGTDVVYQNRLSPALSADGRRVFFTSSDRVLPQDTNDYKDVYAWEEGRLQMISPGYQDSNATFAGADPSGENVFFITRERLVGQDVDDLLDLYDARVGGGIAAQNVPPPGEPCASSDSCKPTAPAPPVSPGAPASATFVGPGNQPPASARCRKGKVRRNGKCRSRKQAKRHQQKQANRHQQKRRGDSSRSGGSR